MLKKFLLLGLISLFLASCKEEEPRQIEPESVLNPIDEQKLLEEKAEEIKKIYWEFNQKSEELLNLYLTKTLPIKKVSLKNISYTRSIDEAVARNYLEIDFSKRLFNKRLTLIIEDRIKFNQANKIAEIKRKFNSDDYGLIYFADNLTEVEEFKYLLKLLDEKLSFIIEFFDNGKVIIKPELKELAYKENIVLHGFKGFLELDLKKPNSPNLEFNFKPLKYNNLALNDFSLKINSDKNANREIVFTPLILDLGATTIVLDNLKIVENNLSFDKDLKLYYQNQNLSLDKLKIQTLLLALEFKNLIVNKEIIKNDKINFKFKIALELGEDLTNFLMQKWGFYNQHLNLDLSFFDFNLEALKSLAYLANNFYSLKEQERVILLLSLFNNTLGRLEAKINLDKIELKLSHSFAEKMNFKKLSFKEALIKAFDFSHLNLNLKILAEVLNNEKLLSLPYLQYIKENSQLDGGMYSFNLEKFKKDFKVKSFINLNQEEK